MRRKNDDNLELSRAMNASCLMDARGQENSVLQSNKMNLSHLDRSYRPSYSPQRPWLQNCMTLSRLEGETKQLGVNISGSQGVKGWSRQQIKEAIKATNKADKGYR